MREFKIGDEVRKYRKVESNLLNYVEIGETGVVIGEPLLEDGVVSVLISNENAKKWGQQYTDIEELELV